jgi:hypothetical protein
MLICFVIGEKMIAHSPILAGIKAGGGIVKRIAAVKGEIQHDSVSFELIRDHGKFNVFLEISEQKIALDENVKMRLMDSVATLLADVPQSAKTRIANCLRGARIVGPRLDLTLVADIVLHTADELSKIHRLGSRSFDYIISSLRDRGLGTAEHLDEDVLAFARRISTSFTEKGIK